MRTFLPKPRKILIAVLFSLLTPLPLAVQAAQGFILSKDPAFSTDDRVFSAHDIVYVKVWDSAIDPTRIKKATTTLVGSQTAIKDLVNNGDTSYTAQFDLSTLSVNQTNWTWSAYIEDRRRVKYQPSAAISIETAPPTSTLNYLPSILKLYNYIANNKGNPPNAIFESDLNGDGQTEWGIYHDYNQDPHHLQNGGAGTSEGQSLFYNFLALYADITGDSSGRDKAMSYFKTYLITADQEHTSLQTPDELMSFAPYLVHWAMDLSGTGPGALVYGQNTCYMPYENRQSFISPSNYLYASAPDADQWLNEGLAIAGEVDTQDQLTAALMTQGLTTAIDFGQGVTPYPNTMKFSLQWTQSGRLPWEGALYTGYQTPSIYDLAGYPAVSADIVRFLEAAQLAYDAQTPASNLGPFFPVYVQSTSYGNQTGWSWSGPDPNTHWAQFQYRTFAHLAYHYYLTDDLTAKMLCDRFINWVKQHTSVVANEVLIPVLLTPGTENVSVVGFDTGAQGLYAQGLVYLAAKSGNAGYRLDAEPVLNTLVNRQAQNDGLLWQGAILSDGSYNAIPSILNFSLMEAGIAMAQYHRLLHVDISNDVTAPTISNITPRNVLSTTARISWVTQEEADSVVEYGTTTSYGFTARNAALAATHFVGLAGLTPSSTYHYRVLSTDRAGNTAQSADQTLQTQADTSDVMVVSDITLTAEVSGKKIHKGRAVVSIQTPEGIPVPNATVSVQWSGSATGSASAATDASGAATIYSTNTQAPSGSFTVTVTDVVSSGSIYDPTRNVVTSRTVTY